MLPLLGKPVLVHTLDRFFAFDPQIKICVVLHPSLVDTWPDFHQEWFSAIPPDQLFACAGGKERTDSVFHGLLAFLEAGLSPSTWIAIHDGVRPFIDQRLLAAGFETALSKGNAVAAVPVKSSLRRATPRGSEAVDRSTYYQVQTPQIFSLAELHTCYQLQVGRGNFTDDASLVEACGQTIHLFEGSYENIKITTPEDLAVAEMLLKRDA
ncbi:UNVERIFIED_CONTAM: hypothetical protein GTU68_052066 [Idotea baltica]|nr:hypothetical protein [Idotea baltica]